MPKATSAPTDTHSIVDTVTKLFTQSPVVPVDFNHLIASQRRNYETIAKVSQLTAEFLNTVLHHQAAIAGRVAEDGSNGLRQLLSAGTHKERIALQADLAKTSFETGVAAFREVSDSLGKASAEATSLLAKRVTDGFAELRGAFSQAEAG
ncbi:MAG TPA: phasin family protein [Alphaproteobacteria bacterium]|nr:phasin family protein [Alphaproteobacteria bacterium]